MTNSVDPDQTAPIGAVCSGATLFAFILISSVLLGNYLQQTTSADNIFRCIFFLGALRVIYSNCVRGYTVIVSFIVIFSDETTESFSPEINVGDNKTITAPVNGDGHACPGDGRLVLSHDSAVPL